MAIYRGDGGAGDATTDITINAVTAKATEAATSATNAANSATSASTSASNAATSATNAANSATSAGTSATSASTSATNASTSASTASTAATDAQTAQTAAETAETNAETAETNAAGSATAAASSATSAASSATTATTKASEAVASASAAASSASAASTSASSASTSATNAATSETNAGNSATAAASSASSASTSASTATTKASEASTSATNAATSETNAATSETNAATSETNAASSASSASTSASTATTQASNAATSASNASTSATNASNSASAASTSETNASNSASAASTSETNAASSATAAAASAVTAASFTPDQTGNSGKYLTTDGSDTSWGTVAGGDVVDDTTPQLGGDLASNGNDINFGDNDKANFGAGSDLQIYHSGSASIIREQGTGSLYIDGSNEVFLRGQSGFTNMVKAIDGGAVQLYHDNDLKIETTATGVSVTGDVTFNDGGKATFGAGSDLQIYHNGSASYIDDAGTGALVIRSNEIQLQKYTGETLASFIADGTVQLRYDNSAKLATSATGVTVTGTVNAKTVDLGDWTITEASGVLKFAHSGTDKMKLDSSGNLTVVGDVTAFGSI